MRISQHISYDEAAKSITALRKGINNIPGNLEIVNMKMLAEEIFEPLRIGLGGFPLKIVSFFRCKELNNAIGGALNSQHMAMNGAAMDIDNDGYKIGNSEIFYFIRNKLNFDQLIWEYGNDKSPDWVHVSYKSQDNRKQVLRAVRGIGYKIFE